MKKIQSVYIFDGGRQGYLNLVDSEEKITFYCQSPVAVTTQSKLDIVFHKTYPKTYTETIQKELAKYRKDATKGDVEVPVVSK